MLDDPPKTGERPFASMVDVARATAALKEAGGGPGAAVWPGCARPSTSSPDAVAATPAGLQDGDGGAIDAGVLARTALVARLLAPDSSSKRDLPMPFQPLGTDEVREFEGLTRVQAGKESSMKLTDKLTRKAKAILDAVTPEALGEAARKVAERWIAGLAPLEPVLVRRPATRTPRRGR